MSGIIEIINNIPKIMILFAPGYIAILIYDSIIHTKKEELSSKFIKSIAYSFAIFVFVNMFDEIHKPLSKLSDLELMIWCTLIAVGSSILFPIIRNTPCWKKILYKIGRITPNDHIWDDVINRKGTRVRLMLKTSKIIYNGIIRLHCVIDNDCFFALSDYDFICPDGDVFDINSKEMVANSMYGVVVINSKDVDYIEFFYDKPVDEVI